MGKNVSLSLSHAVSTEQQQGTIFVWQQLKNQLCLAAHSKTLPRTLPLVRHFLRYCLCTCVLAKRIFIPEPYSIMSVKHPWSFKKKKSCLVQLSRHCINYQVNHLEHHAGNVVNFMTSRQFILVSFPPQWQVKKKMTNLSYPNSGQLQSDNHLSLHIHNYLSMFSLHSHIHTTNFFSIHD